MFNVKSSKHPVIMQDVFNQQKTNSLGLATKQNTEKMSSFSAVGMPVAGLSQGTNLASNRVTVDLEPMLSDIISANPINLLPIYRDMYYNDAVCGSTIDLLSMLPFSGGFTLGKLSSQDSRVRNTVTEAYNESLSRLNIQSYMPEASVDYLTLGVHCSTLLYNKEKKLFTDLMPHDPENLTIEDLPFFSQEPIITVKFDKEILDILKRNSPRVNRIVSLIGKKIVDEILKGSLELQPLSTIFMPRRTFSTSRHSVRGISYLRRILPIYLIEKNLYRGTLMESSRRQRGILHITLGDGDTWIPTPDEYDFVANLFQEADCDPLGAILATRPGISTDELRQGGDFWKVTDFQDSVLSYKLRALGISEGFLSGEATYDNAANALSVFLELLASHRNRIGQSMLTNKLFPLISMVKGFVINKNNKVLIKEDFINNLDSEEAAFVMNDGSKLFVPSIIWNKQLKPEGDSAYVEMLNTLSEKNIPINLRMLAAAGGVNLDDLLASSEDDIQTRTTIAEYQKRVADIAKKYGTQEEVSESSDIENDIANEEIEKMLVSTSSNFSKNKSSVQRNGGVISILNRNFQEVPNYTISKTGKRKAIIGGEHRHNRKVNEIIGKAAARKAKEQNEQFRKKRNR